MTGKLRKRSPAAPQGARGLADLVRAYGRGGPRLLAETAALLGLQAPAPTAPESRESAPKPIPARPPETAPAPVLEPRPLAPALFWRLESVEFLQAPEPGEQEELDPPALPEWKGRPRAAVQRPLTPWPELLPRLRRTLAHDADSRAPDVAAVVRRLGRGEQLLRLPRLRRRRWGAALHIIEDRSERLTPYWRDQAVVRERLLELFPRHAVGHTLIDETVDPSLLTPRNRPPAPGNLVLVLGDLGCLAREDPCLGERWVRMGCDLQRAGSRALVLAPCVPGLCPAEIRRHWRVIPWERGLAPFDPGQCDRGIEQLLCLLSPLSRLEPGLLRELRRLAGLGAAAESMVWQHPVVVSPSSVAATLDPEEMKPRRAEFAAQPAALRKQVLELIRTWRARLPTEVYLGEAALLDADSLALLPTAERSLLHDFFIAFGERLPGIGGALLPQGAEEWAQRFELRSTKQEPIWRRPELHRIWDVLHRYEKGLTPPPGFKPETIPPDPRRPVTAAAIHQRGAALVLTHVGPLETRSAPGTLLAVVTTRNGRIQVEASAAGAFGEEGSKGNLRLHLIHLDQVDTEIRAPVPRAPVFAVHSDRERLTFRRIAKPAWADAIGRDRYGLWSEIHFDAGRDVPVIQRLRWIAPGSFWMGSPKQEPGRWDDEGPRHQITLTRGYWLFDTPCTQALWEVVMDGNPSRFQTPERPVEQVSWEQVMEFIGRINQRVPGLELDLPTEAQWEYACRAGTETAIYTGELEMLGERNAPALDPIAWYGGNSGVEPELKSAYDSSGWEEKQHPHQRAGTHPVGRKQANPWGLYDMLGNVWEWCRDAWHDDYKGAPADGAAWEGKAGAERVVRGGSWIDDARHVRAAYRFRHDPGDRDGSLGFRCARVQE